MFICKSASFIWVSWLSSLHKQTSFPQSPVWIAAALSAYRANVSVTPCVCTMEAAARTLTLYAPKKVSAVVDYQSFPNTKKRTSKYNVPVLSPCALSCSWWHLPGARRHNRSGDDSSGVRYNSWTNHQHTSSNHPWYSSTHNIRAHTATCRPWRSPM